MMKGVAALLCLESAAVAFAASSDSGRPRGVSPECMFNSNGWLLQVDVVIAGLPTSVYSETFQLTDINSCEVLQRRRYLHMHQQSSH